MNRGALAAIPASAIGLTVYTAVPWITGCPLSSGERLPRNHRGYMAGSVRRMFVLMGAPAMLVLVKCVGACVEVLHNFLTSSSSRRRRRRRITIHVSCGMGGRFSEGM